MAVAWNSDAVRGRALARRVKQDPRQDLNFASFELLDVVRDDSSEVEEPARLLTESGKEKVRRFVKAAATAEDLEDVERAFDDGYLSSRLSRRLHLEDGDFEPSENADAGRTVPLSAFAPPAPKDLPPEVRAVQEVSVPPPPLGALALTPSGLAKVRRAIETASNLELLAILDAALKQGDIPRLRDMLNLQGSDLQDVKATSEVKDESGIEELGSTEDEEEDDYDPFATEPSVGVGAVMPPARIGMLDQKPAEDNRGKEMISATIVTTTGTAHAVQSATVRRPPLPRGSPPACSALGSLQSVYDASSSDDDVSQIATAQTAASPMSTRREAEGAAVQRTKKGDRPPLRKKQKTGGKADAGTGEVASQATATTNGKTLPWPVAWAWLLSRTVGHSDFRPPSRSATTLFAADSGEEALKPRVQQMLAIATSLVYVGDTSAGYDPRHLGRVAAVDTNGTVLLDLVVRPRSTILDCRTNSTGLTTEALQASTAVEYETARTKVMELLSVTTLVVGYQVCKDLEALKLWHGPIVDVSLLFDVASRKQHQYHSLRYTAARLLGRKGLEFSRDPYDAVESARLAMELTQYEAKQQTPTPPFEPQAGNPLELLVRHIPHEWGDGAVAKLLQLCPGARQDAVVTWVLNETDPTDWRGDGTLSFTTAAARDAAFEALRGLADVHVQWEDILGMPPLGALMTEQALVRAFSCFGLVVCARIPRKPTTKEPQHFAFISFADREDAQRVARESEVGVEITPDWKIPLRPRLAKYGHANDKRIAVRVGGAGGRSELAFDWVHILRR
eukprot:TRINITY_DN34484_c0_g1_i1.p1 TRINITY_DN34484_c0_g1~~TRINITY_DN34484_c0_g1_i1.p1  ORF type:complete len:792 (-),score=159.36 TRINITY_DN34484_c0_g1_i1:254-2629(-)